jgi:hypothetical protein
LTRLKPRLPGTIQRHAFRLCRCCASQVVQLREHLVSHGEKKRRAWGRMLAREGATRATFDQSCGRKPEQSARRRNKSARSLGCTDAISPSMRARATRAASSSAANALARRVCCAQANLSTMCTYGCRRGQSKISATDDLNVCLSVATLRDQSIAQLQCAQLCHQPVFSGS